ncbi:hypothetical protein RGQ29_032678 [Quercus rubra]|uniref:Uncharacterized protein n=1 Tax=Quercus rubra TaxID=3512 RepID=A0AAN7DVW3_QUERU|nr:hypothetical protein RGQ29_032678 [Quercus rubra]
MAVSSCLHSPHLHQTSVTKTKNKKQKIPSSEISSCWIFFSFSVDGLVKGLLASFVTWISQMPQFILESEIPKVLTQNLIFIFFLQECLIFFF